jgi:hypothetical protein
MYLDDIRTPAVPEDWIIVRSSQQAIEYVQQYGMPASASFDHDLGGEDTTMIFLKWLVEMDMHEPYKFIPKDFCYTVHSANPVGKENIKGYLNSYIKFRNEG